MRKRYRRPWAVLLGASLWLAACSGQIEDLHPEDPAPGGGGPPAGTGGPPGANAPACDPKAAADPGPTPLLKLSTVQYRNTVVDLLAASGMSSVAGELAPLLAGIPEDSGATFKGADNRISLDHVSGYFQVATGAAAALTGTPERLAQFAGACATAQPLAARCLDDFLAGFGRRALRRPLSPEELASYRQLNDGQRSPAELFRAATVLLMTTPAFVNHLELDGQPVAGREDLLALTPHEIASRLSYTFWHTMPDEPLFAAAADGSLATEAGFARQLDRVFADRRTRQTLWQFWNEWLHLDAFTGFDASRPGFAALAAGENVGAPGRNHYGDMVQELRELTEAFTWGRMGTLADLLTTDASVTRSPDLARLYGVQPWSGSGEYPRFPGGNRGGLLQRAALLVSSLEQTNPFHRGSLVRRAILCDPLPRPDPAALPPGALDPPPPSAAESTRQRFGRKTEGPLCSACHTQFNDIGFVLEAYDALGRHRTKERVFDEKNGALLAELPIDTTAPARVQLSDDRPVSGPAELNQRIVESKKVERCLASNYFLYVFRRENSAVADSCVVGELAAQVDQAGLGLAEAFKRIALSPGFRRRKVGRQ